MDISSRKRLNPSSSISSKASNLSAFLQLFAVLKSCVKLVPYANSPETQTLCDSLFSCFSSSSSFYSSLSYCSSGSSSSLTCSSSSSSDGFSVLTVRGMLYNPVTGSWCWSDNTEINYALHAVKAAEEPPHRQAEPEGRA